MTHSKVLWEVFGHQANLVNVQIERKFNGFAKKMLVASNDTTGDHTMTL